MENLLEKYGYGRLSYELKNRSNVCRRYKDGMLFDYFVNGDTRSYTVVVEGMKNRIVGKNSFHEIYDIGFIPESGLDKDGLVENEPFGKKCRISDGLDIYDYFVYGKDEEPEWFDLSKFKKGSDKIYLERSLNGWYVAYVINDRVDDDRPYRILIEELFNKWYVPLLDDSWEYSGIERNEGSTCPVGGCVDKSAAARFCRCRNDHSVIHEYFIYGTDTVPEWFEEKYPHKKEVRDIYLNKKRYVVKRGDTGYLFFLSEEGFKEKLQDCQSDGTVECLSEGQIDEYIKGFENLLSNPIKVDTAKYAMDRLIDSFAGNVTERPKKMVVDDGPKTFTDVKDVDSAKLWFHGLPPEVFMYLVVREMSNNNGVVDMVKLHKSETNGTT